jgi:DNA-binding transcriptional LysR family regulator
MKNYRRNLPPLDMLFFFEAAYRRGSFTACAAELNVSQAAVSKRVRQLEDWIGDPLFVRRGKKLFPTNAGDRLYQTTSVILEFLQQGIASLREEARRPLSIGANTSIGMFWLTVQLREFGFSGDACPTRLLTSDNTEDLLSDSNDLIVTYGGGNIPGWYSVLLLEEELSPVASPELAAEFGPASIETLNDITVAGRPPLLNYPRSGPDWIDWRAWFDALSMQGLDRWRIDARSTYSQTIGEAIRGRGIALGSLPLLGAELTSGSLVRLTSDVLRTGRGYYLCHAMKSGLSSDARSLSDFLITAASRSDAHSDPTVRAR